MADAASTAAPASDAKKAANGAAAAAATADEKPDWWLLLDLTELVPFVATTAGVIAFNKSEYGRQFYERYFKRFPDPKVLAKVLFRSVGGKLFFPTYYGPVLFFMFVDFFRSPKFIYDLRIQKKDPPSLRHYIKVFLAGILGQIFIMRQLQKYILFPLYVWRKGHETVKKMPSAMQTIKELVFLETMFGFLFYVTHGLFLHHKLFYKWFHKMHHENSTPFTLAALYQHPVELIGQTGICVSLPAVLLPVHPSSYWGWLIYRNIDAFANHCGYHIPFFPVNPFHDFHHRTFESNYGISPGFPIWDYLFGTHEKYMPWIRNYWKTHHWLTHQRISPDGTGFKDVDVGGELE